MIVADTNVWIAFLSGQNGKLTALLEQALRDRVLFVPVPVLHELICYPELNDIDRRHLLELPRPIFSDQTWIKASELRKQLLGQKKKARAIDSLIAQCCIENSYTLLSDDRDMKHYVSFGLKLRGEG